MKKYLLTGFLVCLCTQSYAQQAPSPTPQVTVAPEPSQQYDLTRQQVETETKLDDQAKSQSHTLSMTSAQLLQRPALLQNALDSSITRNNVDGVRLLLPLYKKLDKQDPILVLFAQAFLDRTDGNFRSAIDSYQQILAQRPDLTPVRFQLAQTLAINKDYDGAKDQFNRIRSQSNVPKPILGQINRYEDVLKKNQDWQFSFGGRYLSENNVNQAPAQSVIETAQSTITLPKPQSAHGLGYRGSVSKDTLIKDNWFFQFNTSVDGKFYWDNHAYDDLIARVYAGVAYKTARSEFAILPFYEKRWFATEQYSYSPGLRLSASYIVTPKFQLLTSFDNSNQKYNSREFLNGSNHSASITVVYRTSPVQYLVAGYDFTRSNARDTSNAYTRNGVRVGWGRDWEKGISSSVFAGAATRNYDAPDFFNIKRKDKEYFVSASVWNRNWSWKGFTPKLTWSWNQLKSNHFYYGYRNSNVFVEVSKQF